MKSNDVNCFDARKVHKKTFEQKTANDQDKHRYLRIGSDGDLWNQGCESFTLPHTDLVKLRIFSTLHDLTPEEVLATALREYFENNGPDKMKTVFNNLDDKFSLKSDAN